MAAVYFQTGAETIHLYHERIWFNQLYEAERNYNRNLYFEKAKPDYSQSKPEMGSAFIKAFLR